jgi:HD-like signal output (HDOD) protein
VAKGRFKLPSINMLAMDQKLKSRIDEIIEKTTPIPQHISNLMKMLKDENVPLSRVAIELAKDPVLTADTIRMVNSAYYGFSQEIKSLEQAVVILGTKALLRLVVAAWAKRISSQELKNFRTAQNELAIFSLVGAVASVKFGEISGIKFMSDIIFTSAALRSIGRVIMDKLGAAVINNILKEVFEKKVSFYTASKRILGFSHSEIGAYALRKWGIPEDLASVVEHYQTPSEFQEDKTLSKVAACVHLGDIAAMQIGEGAPVDGMLYQVDKGAFSILGLDSTENIIEKVCEMILPEVEKIKETFQLQFGI